LELYFFLLSLPSAIKKVAEQKIEAGLSKYQPTPLEANPNRRFVNNKMMALLEEDTKISDFCAKHGLRWGEHSSFVKKLYASIISKDYYNNYMESAENTFEDDMKLIATIFEEELEDSDDLYTILEDDNLYWMDDLAFVINIITKRLYALKENNRLSHPDMFLKNDDKEYALKLLNASMLRYEEYTALITEFVINWETDRLASTDITLIVMGVAEAVAFSNIPIKVTINEYVELAKYYSTPNSKVFVNGLLDRILISLKESGEIEKSGRGLVGSPD
jgi:N utilization substance protein B